MPSAIGRISDPGVRAEGGGVGERTGRFLRADSEEGFLSHRRKKKAGSTLVHLHGLENNQTSGLRLKRGVHDGKNRRLRLESGTHAPGTQEPTEGTRHPSHIPGEEHQEQPHMAEGRLRDAQPEPLVLYG